MNNMIFNMSGPRRLGACVADTTSFEVINQHRILGGYNLLNTEQGSSIYLSYYECGEAV